MGMSVSQMFGRKYASEATGKQSAVRMYFINATYSIIDLDDVVTNALANGLPALGDAYSASAPYLVATQHIPQEVGHGEKKIYNIEVRYDSSSFGWAFPTSQPWVARYSTISQEYVPPKTRYDANAITFGDASIIPVGINEPIINTAGIPFTDPPVTATRTLAKLTLTKNINHVTDLGTIADVHELMDYVHCINTNPVVDPYVVAGLSCPKGTLYIEEITIENSQANGQDYYAFSISMIYDPYFHAKIVLNAGKQTIKNGKVVALRNSKGEAYSDPLPLDANGDPIDGIPAVRQANSIYLAFGLSGYKNFSDLGLPITF